MQITHKTFRNIGLLGRPDKSSVVETLCLIHDHLVSRGLHPVFDQETAQLVPYTDPQTVSRALLGEIVDLVIVVGGDGSLLHATPDPARSPFSSGNGNSVTGQYHL